MSLDAEGSFKAKSKKKRGSRESLEIIDLDADSSSRKEAKERRRSRDSRDSRGSKDSRDSRGSLDSTHILSELSLGSSKTNLSSLSTPTSAHRARRNSIVPTDTEVSFDTREDHSGGWSRRSSSKQERASRRQRTKKVRFSPQLVDPRPEQPPDLSLDVQFLDCYLDYSQGNYSSADHSGGSATYAVPPRMRKSMRRLNGRWRRWIPFGQFIPRFPSFSDW
ncbi:hypothetical protein B484DRAFT_409636 [Ochromonadaceae sp. CCMP2298]|nr:hypothetical protein B484DRAFT_409636 [Ochromonadaceae sp. CCMP2298]|mmetsp:Transcript_13419/g.29652  ORF Transcript_13419/g.29652 Transcript_13419/m.29652 type:complete len:221 (+) Transcript_13419:176-838(+)